MKCMKIKKYLGVFLVIMTFGLHSCQSNSSLEDGNLNMELLNLKDFNTKKYYAKSMKAEWSDFHKHNKAGVSPIYFFQSKADTIDVTGSNFRMGKPYAIMYLKSGSGGMNSWAKDFNLSFFKNLKFVDVGAITDMDNNLLMLASTEDNMKKSEVATFVIAMDKQFGKADLNVTSHQYFDTEIRKWILKDRIITLISSGNFHKIDDENLTETQKEYISKKLESPNTDARLYITKKDYENIFKQMSTKMSFLVDYK